MGETGSVYNIFVGRPERKSPGIPMLKSEDNIKIDVKNTVRGCGRIVLFRIGTGGGFL
jgi:hypothetical protein